METGGGGGVLREFVCDAWRLLCVVHLIGSAQARGKVLAGRGHRAWDEDEDEHAVESDSKLVVCIQCAGDLER